jgi:hypothetical protein
MEPITLAKAGLAITKGGKAIVALLSEQKKLDKIYAEICDEILSEVVARVAAIEARMDAEQQRRFEEEQAKPDAQAYARVLFQEAAKSVTRERRIMIAAAIAGGVTPDFEAEERSRLARALAQLEPSDVSMLRALEALDSDDRVTPQALHYELNTRPAASRQAVVAAGCVEMSMESRTRRERDHSGRLVDVAKEFESLAKITWLGYAVIRAVEGRLLSESEERATGGESDE